MKRNSSASASTRRGFLGASAGTLALATSAGCDTLATDPEESEPDGARADKGAQAPSLAERVEAGELPPVEGRIPNSPLTVEPLDRIGVYGGTWNSALLGPDDVAWLERTIGYENLTRWDLGFEEVIPNVAEDISVEQDGHVFVISLRPGMRWSDGQSFTAADVIFAYDDVLGHSDISEDYSDFYRSGGELGEIEEVDEHTVRFTFAAPNGLFLEHLATPYAFHLTNYARHYFEQFHETYNPDVEELAADEGFSSWLEMFDAKQDRWNNTERPALWPWIPEQLFGEGEQLVWVRNPYYFKVDPEGSQLPYIDRLVHSVIQDEEVMLLRATEGEIDMQDRTFNSPSNKPVLARARDEGNFRFVDEPPTNSVTIAIALNLTHQDPAKREMFQNKDFRIGLSHAINRQEVIDTVYQQQGEPHQVAPRPDSPFHDEEMAKQYTEFDVDLANDHLDRAGYTDRDGEGFRLGPDGARIAIAVEFVAGDEANAPLEVIAPHWAEVGVQLRITPQGRGLFEERRRANEHDAAVWGAEGGGRIEPILRTDWYFPSGTETRNYAPLWLDWYESNGEGGEEPPAPVMEQIELYRELQQTIDEDERNAVMEQILQMAKEYFYHIGVSLAPDWYGIVKNNFHNVPTKMPASFVYPTPAPSNPEQYFISDD